MVGKTLSVLSLAVILAAVAGCGGGGSKTAGPPPKPTQVQLNRELKRSTVELYGREGDDYTGGSGIVINKDEGLVLTNAHVIAGVSALRVQHNTDDVAARVIGVAPCEDVALIKTVSTLPGLRSIHFAKTARTIRSGAKVTVMGFPGDFQDKPEIAKPTASPGQVAVDGVITASPDPGLPHYSSVIKHEATVNHGDSGGPLVNDRGKLVGMNSLLNPSTQNEYYAISVDRLRELLPDLKRGRRIAWVGWDLIPTSELSDDDLDTLGWQWDPRKVGGLAVVGVDQGSPAEKQKFHFGDYLYEIAGSSVDTVGDVCDILQSKEGQQIRVRGAYEDQSGSFDSRRWYANLQVH